MYIYKWDIAYAETHTGKNEDVLIPWKNEIQLLHILIVPPLSAIHELSSH